MFSVALWSKFPNRYIETKIFPKLLERGISVSKKLSPATKTCDLANVDVVLFLHEFASHSEQDRIEKLAKRYNKEVILISRKSAVWNDLPKRIEMGAPRTISDQNLEAFLRKYIDLKEKGLSLEQMLKPLGKFWERGELTNSGQLKKYINNLLRYKATPEFFLDYWNGRNTSPVSTPEEPIEPKLFNSESKFSASAIESQKPSQEPADVVEAKLAGGSSQPTALVETKPEIAPEPSPTPDPPLAQTKDIQILEEMYQKEVGTLLAKVDTLEKEYKRLKAVSNSTSNFEDIMQILRRNVELGLMDKSEAFDRLVRKAGV